MNEHVKLRVGVQVSHTVSH